MTPILIPTMPVLCWFRVVYRKRNEWTAVEDDTIMVHATRSQDLRLELEIAVRERYKHVRQVTHVQLRQYLPRCGEANF